MSDTSAVSLPRAPEPATPFRFPVLATIAPVVVSVGLWLVTGSAFALLFAALGPITALASLADSRLGSRRTVRRERQRFASEVEVARSVIRERHAIELSDRDESAPDAAAIVLRTAADHSRWSRTPAVVTLGRGRVDSAIRLEQRVRPTRPDTDVERELDDLEAFAATLERAPVVADASVGIGVFGPPLLASALARGFALQLAWSLAPSGYWCAAIGSGHPEGEWLGALPHRRGRDIRPGHQFEFGRVDEPEPCAFIAVASTADQLPGSCRVVVRVGADAGVSVVQHPDRPARQHVTAVFVSREEAAVWAREVAAFATRHGLAEPNSTLPGSVSLAPLLAPAHDVADASLAARVAVTAAGTLQLDLVEHGPHAVVGGTTGSGKSELLIAWVLAMAAAHPPERVTFLLVDFKGGAAFGALRDLPHTVGTITDLDARAAARALASLRAELSHRERTLAAVGARDIDEYRSAASDALPRLVIVVDEFAAMLADHPDLHALFADIAARGRSLGVHLVLCTQRPAGVVRDGLLANADLRVSLRVNNPGDSTAVVGSDAAALIPAEYRGRAVVSVAGGRPQLAQFALAAPEDARAIAALWPGSAAPRRPWLEPLPTLVTRLDSDGEGSPFGLLDLPAQQRRATATWRPHDGHVLVLGAPGSGKSSALRALGAAAAVEVPGEAGAAWDAVADLVARLDSPARPLTVVIDDLDALVARFAPDHRAVVVDRLARVLREGAAHGIRVAIAAQRLSSDLQSLASLVPARLWLRHASRQELVMSGGDGADHDDRLPPGGGRWRGERVQVLWCEPESRHPVPPRVSLVDPAESLAVVSARPGWIAQRLEGHGRVVRLAETGPDAAGAFERGVRTVLIGDVDDWQSRWGALAAVRSGAGILFHGCSVADYRALTRSRDLPPPLGSDPMVCWRLEPDGSVTRARLPGSSTT